MVHIMLHAVWFVKCGAAKQNRHGKDILCMHSLYERGIVRLVVAKVY